MKKYSENIFPPIRRSMIMKLLQKNKLQFLDIRGFSGPA